MALDSESMISVIPNTRRLVEFEFMSTPFRLDGLRALVTGGASGIGEATSRVLAQAGAAVTIADIDRPRAEALAAELSSAGLGASALILDITNGAEVERAFAAIPRLDILINNAGIGLVGNVEETGLDDFQRLFKVNVEGLYLVTKAAMPKLVESKGTIVNLGSVAGLVGLKRRFAYCATKGAVVALSRQLALDYVGKVRVNCVCPGTIESPFVDAYLQKFHAHEIEKTRAELHARQPVGRMGRPLEVANMILYLCSREAEFVTGSCPTIDGGLTAA
jgi:NAD(P)-dependent dehydrogenase (short-subunit alcohol dehydrogenase family)